MLLAVSILAVMAGVLALIALIPGAPQEPARTLALFLLAVAVFLLGAH